MKKDLVIKYNDKVVKTLTRKQLVEQVPHDPKAGEYWDKINGKVEKPKEN